MSTCLLLTQRKLRLVHRHSKSHGPSDSLLIIWSKQVEEYGDRRVGNRIMAACTFCGSKDIRRSASSALDATATRVRRALTFRCLYRCRSCDALFEALLSPQQSRSSKSNGSDPVVSPQKLVEESGSPVVYVPRRPTEPIEELAPASLPFEERKIG